MRRRKKLRRPTALALKNLLLIGPRLVISLSVIDRQLGPRGDSSSRNTQGRHIVHADYNNAVRCNAVVDERQPIGLKTTPSLRIVVRMTEALLFIGDVCLGDPFPRAT